MWNTEHDGICMTEGVEGLETHNVVELSAWIHFIM